MNKNRESKSDRELSLDVYDVGTVILIHEEKVAAQKHEKGWFLAQDWEIGLSSRDIAAMGEYTVLTVIK